MRVGKDRTGSPLPRRVATAVGHAIELGDQPVVRVRQMHKQRVVLRHHRVRGPIQRDGQRLARFDRRARGQVHAHQPRPVAKRGDHRAVRRHVRQRLGQVQTPRPAWSSATAPARPSSQSVPRAARDGCVSAATTASPRPAAAQTRARRYAPIVPVRQNPPCASSGPPRPSPRRPKSPTSPAPSPMRSTHRAANSRAPAPPARPASTRAPRRNRPRAQSSPQRRPNSTTPATAAARPPRTRAAAWAG